MGVKQDAQCETGSALLDVPASAPSTNTILPSRALRECLPAKGQNQESSVEGEVSEMQTKHCRGAHLVHVRDAESSAET